MPLQKGQLCCEGRFLDCAYLKNLGVFLVDAVEHRNGLQIIYLDHLMLNAAQLVQPNPTNRTAWGD